MEIIPLRSELCIVGKKEGVEIFQEKLNMDFMGPTSSFETAVNQHCFGAHQRMGGAVVMKIQ